MREKLLQHEREAGSLVEWFCRWVGIAALIGIVGGLVGSAFHMSVEYATKLRMNDSWLIYCLPVAGLVIAWLYRTSKLEDANTDSIIDSIHLGVDVPYLLTPVIFLSTVLTHLGGGSAGREGAALQIGGSLGCNLGRMLKLDEKQERIATLSGMSAVFSALFGTPVTASVFALEVCSVGIIHYSGLVPCMVASMVAYYVTQLFGIAPTRFAVEMVALEPVMLLKVVVLAVACALVSVVFCELLHFTGHGFAKLIPNVYTRVFVGGVLVMAMTHFVGTQDYNGAGMGIISAAIEQGQTRPMAFLAKMLFTAVTLGCGFKGGEVVPTFFVGATLGCLLGPILGIPAGFAAALGLAATFCGAVNCPIATVMLALELFGGGGLVYFASACFISYMLSGYSSLYREQRIMYSKLKAEYINRQAE